MFLTECSYGDKGHLETKKFQSIYILIHNKFYLQSSVYMFESVRYDYSNQYFKHYQKNNLKFARVSKVGMVIKKRKGPKIEP